MFLSMFSLRSPGSASATSPSCTRRYNHHFMVYFEQSNRITSISHVGYIRMTEILRGVDGSQTVLAPHHGFRKFVQAKAMEIGITGSIQRYHHSDVRMRYEGTASQVNQFIHFLDLCRGHGMISVVDQVAHHSVEARRFHDFFIDRDFNFTVVNGGRLLKGTYSDGNEFDKVRTNSADLTVLLGSQIERRP